MSQRNRNLPMAGQSIEESLLIKGQTIIVVSSAGPRLAGKSGIVTGKGATKSQVRVLLDGSKGCITLHARFLSLLQSQAFEEPIPDSRDDRKEKQRRKN
ncbi:MULTISPECIES: hypothetical protein [Bradyrhizobium]|uniref:hypothetical protein n=1 Tax=Bradyrhizobium TaxID=374 RepID=UPI001EDA5706|nr:hypothetical protein [Bradyrhizobium zhengyangense]MCG2645684.1 hypothetical protein [Bradyrhizobium zhengyangense]